MFDTLGRPFKSLRISVTDRCNLRCRYCMPEENYVWLPRKELLTFEELARLARIARALGVEKVRITGGEPLLRKDLHRLVEMLEPLGFAELAMTTNGLLLRQQARNLKEAGLDRVTVSLDSLKPDVFQQISRRDGLDEVLQAIRQCPFPELKIDTVVLKGVNDQEVPALLDFAKQVQAEIRFIEYMDVGGATQWSRDQVTTAEDILAMVGPAERLGGRGSAPAQRYRLPGGQVFGIIASVTKPFCRDCDRARLTADGHLLLCLYARTGLDLRTPMREGASDEELARLLGGQWRDRQDRGAELRAGLADRSVFADRGSLIENPRLEMHTRGG